MSARKYRQRGYQDDDREREPRRTGRAVRPDRGGPRGRGLGRPTETLFKCARCGRKLPIGEGVARTATCDGCGAELHACANCQHFDTSARFECREEIPERIAAKSSANECERFEPKRVQGFASEDAPSDGKAAFDALFDF